MAKSATPTGVDGLVVIDKPQDWTSHDVVARARKILGTRKIGHAGTLDPMATGVLLLGVGKATRLLTYLVGADKAYQATIRLGVATVTDDAQGETAAVTPAHHLSDEAIGAAIANLTGTIDQVPSSVSAIKVAGQRSYARVRAGQEVALPPRPVRIARFDIHDIRRITTAGNENSGAEESGTSGSLEKAATKNGNSESSSPENGNTENGNTENGNTENGNTENGNTENSSPVKTNPTNDNPGNTATDNPTLAVIDVDVFVECSPGTYIRALARDLGTALGVGGHLTALRRTRVGPFGIETAVSMTDFAADPHAALRPLAQVARSQFPVRELTDEQAQQVRHGQRPGAAAMGEQPYAAFAPDGSLVAIMREESGKTKLDLVFSD